jgi:hypothetical protein
MPDVRMAVVALLLLGMALFGGWMAHGAPPPGADLSGSVHAWFDRQKNMRGTPCCSVADGHVIDDEDWRISGAHHEVRIGGVWMPVPDDRLRDPAGGPNPMGRPIVWYADINGVVIIYCLAPGTQL